MSGQRSTAWDQYTLTESGLYLADNTIANASTSKHGLLPKLSGVSTEFLNGAGAFATPAGGGGLIFLERHAASASSSLDFTTFISATYDKYLIVGENLVPATSAASLYLEIGTGGTPTYDTGNNYEWASTGVRVDSGAAVFSSGFSAGPAKIFTSMANTAGYGFGNFSLVATGLQSTSVRKSFHGTTQFVNSTPLAVYSMLGCQWTTTATAATAIRFIMSSGNITSGSITIYGYTNS